MVLPGQFLERSVVVKSGALLLDGLYHRGDQRPPCVLAAPHPALGGSMVAPVIAELAWALAQAGHATLRFDYRGVGASQGRSRQTLDRQGRQPLAELSEEAEDLLAAADQLTATAGGPLCAIGYSFGAGVALSKANDDRFDRLVLVAPPTAMIDFSALAGVEKPVLLACPEEDPICDRAELTRLIEPLGGKARIFVVPESDHVFRRGLPELGHEVVRWLGSVPRREREGPRLVESSLEELELDEGEGPALELDDG